MNHVKAKMFFDFMITTLNKDHDLKTEARSRITQYDPGKERENWESLTVPKDMDPAAMSQYIDNRLKMVSAIPGGMEMETLDSPNPGSYCYPGNKEICYHRYTIKIGGVGGSLWSLGAGTWLTPMEIVFGHETGMTT